MAKRILAMLLALTMVWGVLPTGVIAEAQTSGISSQSDPAQTTYAPLEAHDDTHICEHCAAQWLAKPESEREAAPDLTPAWIAWQEQTSLPDASGHYYLTGDVTLGQAVTLDDEAIVLCLNGKAVTTGGTENTEADRIYRLTDTAELTILDCTANTVTENGTDLYKAGTLTGATYSAILVEDTAVFTMYDGLLSGNSNTNGSKAGALHVSNNGTARIYGGVFRDNSAKNGAAIYAHNSAKLWLENVQITGNTGTQTGAIHAQNAAQITIKDSSITGNTAQDAHAAGVYLTSYDVKLTLSGKVIIDDNHNAQDNAARNLQFYRSDGLYLYIDELAEGSRVQFTIRGKENATQTSDVLKTADGSLPTSWACGWLTYGDQSISLHSGALVFGHYHGDTQYTAWTDAGALPSEAGAYYLAQDVQLGGEYSCKWNVTLCLNGHDIQAAAGKRIMSTASGTPVTITLEDCTAYTDASGKYISGAISGGQDLNTAKVGGGAVYLRAGSTMNMYGGSITDNTSITAGGAFLLAGTATLNLYGGEISDNTAVAADGTTWKTGGAIYLNTGAAFNMYGGTICNNNGSDGGAVYASKAPVLLKGGMICDNTATNTGGGIFATGKEAVVTCSGGTVCHNTAKNGGGILTQTQSAFLLQSGSVADNTATSSGGGVYVSTGTTFTMEGGSVANNKADNGAGVYLLRSSGTFSGGSITANSTSVNGGGIYLDGSSAKLSGVQVTGNTSAGEGGGIYSRLSTRNETNYYPGLTITAGSVTGNTASKAGGIYAAADMAPLSLQGTPVITGNTADGAASNLYLASTLAMELGQLEQGADIGLTAENAPRAVSGETAADYSGSFRSDSADCAVQFRDSKLYLTAYSDHMHCLCMGSTDGCDHTELAWQVWDKTDSLPTSGSYYLKNDVVLTDVCTIPENSSLNLCLSGHTVTAAENQRLITVRENANVSITDCKAYTDGDGSYTAGALTGGNEMGNNVGGGAIWLRAGSVLNLYGGRITGNNSISAAGAILLAGTATLNMYGGEISNNTALSADGATWKNGGAIYLNPNAAFYMYGGTIRDNQGVNGGAVYSKRSQVQLLGGTVSGNSAENGGGLYLEDAPATIGTNAVISGNAATVTGGGIFATGSGSVVTMNGGNISGNTAPSGAGVITQTQSAFLMKDGSITGNTAASGGAGIYISSGTSFTMEGGSVSGNTAANGAGVYLLRSEGSFTGGQITANSASGNGGGIYASGAELTLGGTNIQDNTASGNGGGVYTVTSTRTGADGTKTYYYPELTVTAGSVSGNKAGSLGGGIYAAADTGKLALQGQPVITGNTAGGAANNLYLAGDLVMELGTVGKGAKVGISAAKALRAISTKTQTDHTASFISDSAYRTIYYQDQVLYLGAVGGHAHCICNASSSGCDHSTLTWLAWESTTSLPTESGNYYLIADVQLTAAAVLETDQTVNLCLNGHTVTAAKDQRHLQVKADTILSITDCATTPGSFTGGSRTYGASVNVNREGMLKLFAGKFYGNTATDSEGGAIYIQAGNDTLAGGTFHMYGGQISGNTAAKGGGVTAAGGNFCMYGGQISGNTATYNGGGILLSGDVQAHLYGGSISGNKADGTYETEKDKGNGGGIYAAGAVLTIEKDMQITGNTAIGSGGGLLITGSTTAVTMNGGKITGNTAKNGGGVITQTRSSFVLNDGTISDNQVTAGGGGLYISSNTTLTVNGGTVSGNTAKYGGGVYLLRSAGIFAGGTIEQNKATDGGGMYLGGAEITLSGTAVRKNTASGNGGGIRSNVSTVTNSSTGQKTVYPAVITMSGGSVSGNTAAKIGGGIVVQGDGSVMTMSGGSIESNQAANGGGVITQTKAKLILKDGLITKNTTTASGAGVYISADTTLQMQGGTVSYNHAKGSAGGVYLLRSQGVLSGGAIRGNTAEKNGAGLYIGGSKATLSGVSIQNNSTEKGNGGGVHITGSSATKNGVKTTYTSSVTISGGRISGNSAVHGGGILCQSNNSQLQLTGGSITENTAQSNGGGLYISTNTTFLMSGGSITDNTAQSNGGGIYHLRSVGSYTGGTIQDNTAMNTGGAMVVSGQTAVVTMKDMQLTGHKAASGGAIVCQSKGTVQLENCEIFGNEAGKTAGGIYISNNSFGDLVDTKLYENTAGDSAGAFFNAVGTNVTMTRVTVTNNQATGYGGGIYCRGNLTMTDCEVSANSTAGDGGGIATWKMGTSGIGIQPGLVTQNLKVDANTAGGMGGGVYLHIGSRATLRDTAITNNKAGAEGSGLWAIDDLTMHSLTVTGNTGSGAAVYLAPSSYDGHSYFTGVFKLSGDTYICDNAGMDLYLGERSAIAVGGEGIGQAAKICITLDSGLLTDRVIGAYNYEGGSCVYTITYGDRSVTDPEYNAPAEEPENPTQDTQNTEPAGETSLLYAGVGAFAVVIAAIAVIVVLVNRKKKKAAQTPAETTQE